MNITSSENTNTSKSDSKAGSGGVGVSFNTSGLSGVNAGYSAYKGKAKENDTTHTNSTVTASDKLTVESSQDTNIVGGKVSGDSVVMKVGEDLNIESQKDSRKYDEKYTAGGLSIDIDLSKVKPSVGVGGSISSGKTNSDYSSVTEQSGIYAGEGGFDITVDKNTDLKGGVIDSDATADKNKLTTGTLTWEDIDNKAEYSSKDVGINVNINNGAQDNEKGVTPNIGMPAEGEAESDTKATIAEGEIEIRDKENQKQNVADLNRDTQNSLNKLAEIFDRNTVAEKQEFAGLLQEVAHSAIGDLTGKISAEEKAVLNVFVDGIISSLSNGDFLAGASGTALVESMHGALSKIKDPALRQIAAGVLGAAISEALTGKGQAGASSAVSTEKYNHLPHEEQERLANTILNAKNQNDIVNIIDAALEKSTELRESDPGKAEDIEQVVLDAFGTLTKYDKAGVSFEPNGELGVHQNLLNAKEFLKEYEIVKHLPTVFGEAVKLTAVEITAPIEIVNGVLIIGDLLYEIKGNYDKYGNSKEFILDSGVDTVKAGVYHVGGKLLDKKLPGVVTIITEAGFITAINNKLDNKDWNWSD